ncbi:uncharacterized protein LOC143207927 [Lasioglossum baleicum]|uniref:uncharacterized protein LOC143207927 n=1 Tax=Lasioglossum baleicum TaxID=434251 RepID=UPI003FCE8236
MLMTVPGPRWDAAGPRDSLQVSVEPIGHAAACSLSTRRGLSHHGASATLLVFNPAMATPSVDPSTLPRKLGLGVLWRSCVPVEKRRELCLTEKTTSNNQKPSSRLWKLKISDRTVLGCGCRLSDEGLSPVKGLIDADSAAFIATYTGPRKISPS